MKGEDLRSIDNFILWNEILCDNHSSFVGVFQVYSDGTAMILETNAIVAYCVHVILMKNSKEFRLYLMGHE